MLAYLFIAIISIIPAWIFTKIIAVIYALTVAPFRRNKCIKDKSYKTVVAEEVTKKAAPDDDGRYKLVYKYEVDGKTYKTVVTTQWDTEPYRTLYYIKNPGQAVDNIYKLGKIENQRTITIILAAIFFIIILLVWKMH